MLESAFHRAWRDTDKFRRSAKSFWMFEVVGAAMFGIIGAIGAFWLTPQSASPFQQNSYPAIGGGIGIIVGFITVFALVFVWNLFRAPYRQRNEARADAIQRKEEYDELKQSIKEQKQSTLVLTPHTYAIGLSGMTGYPDKSDNAYWLCLEVTVHPSSKPIDTLDLLIGATTIPANDWPGKNVAAFSVYFNVTDWKWKGEIQVELQARIQGVVHSSVRIPIDFNVEPGGSHRI